MAGMVGVVPENFLRDLAGGFVRKVPGKYGCAFGNCPIRPAGSGNHRITDGNSAGVVNTQSLPCTGVWQAMHSCSKPAFSP